MKVLLLRRGRRCWDVDRDAYGLRGIVLGRGLHVVHLLRWNTILRHHLLLMGDVR
jgi:hypothetical protein